LLIDNPDTIATKLDSIVGVVEHGLFLHMAHSALIAGTQEIIELTN
jgi:ribose 5-phosphate isomerase A